MLCGKKASGPVRQLVGKKILADTAVVGYKAIALGQCLMWQEALAGSGIDVIGAGGIFTGADAAAVVFSLRA